jgi:hypothetical protein
LRCGSQGLAIAQVPDVVQAALVGFDHLRGHLRKRVDRTIGQPVDESLESILATEDPTGKFVVAGAIDYTMQRWEIASGKKTALLGHDNWVRTLGFSPDGTTLYSGGYDGRWIAWDTAAENPQPRQTVETKHGWVRGIAVSHDGQRIATVGNDRTVKVWSANDGILLRKMDGADIHNMIGDIAPFGGIIHLAFSSDMQRLTSCGLHKTSNAPAGNRRAVAMSFDWKTGEKLPKQESIAKGLDSTMWRVQYHSSGVMLGIVEKEIGFWKNGEEELFHRLATPSDIFDFDLHPNQTDLFTAHFDGHDGLFVDQVELVAKIYAGNYRMRISLWGFQWNQGKPVACNAPQAAALRAHAEGKQQEGGRLLRLFTAPSMKSNEVEFTAWIDPLESIVFDPVSIPWNGLRIGQVAGRASKHQGPGVAIDWFEIEGPICDSWPPPGHQVLFGKLPIKPLSPGGDSK